MTFDKLLNLSEPGFLSWKTGCHEGKVSSWVWICFINRKVLGGWWTLIKELQWTIILNHVITI